MTATHDALENVVNMLIIALNTGVLDMVRDWDTVQQVLVYAAHDFDALPMRGSGITKGEWGFDTFAPQQYKELFRFKTREDIEQLMDALDFPQDEYWHVSTGSKFTRDAAFLLFLRRMAYPCRLIDLATAGFPAQKGALSELLTMVNEWMFEHHTKRLLQ